MPEDVVKPTAEMAANAKRGLALREKHNRGGTEVGVARAEGLAARKPLPPGEIAKIASYFARHAVDKEAPKFGNDDDPSAGYIAWLLWGGDAGQDWAQKHKEKNDAVQKG